MSNKRKHQQSLAPFGQGLVEDTTRFPMEIPGEPESRELWNDYATAQFVSQCADKAVSGYRRART
jgi:hypothetical protein